MLEKAILSWALCVGAACGGNAAAAPSESNDNAACVAARTKVTAAWNGYADVLDTEREKLTPDPARAKLAAEAEAMARRTAAEIEDPALRAELEAELEAGSQFFAKRTTYVDGLKAAAEDARGVGSAYAESYTAGVSAEVDAKAVQALFDLGQSYGDALKEEVKARGGFVTELHPSTALITAKAEATRLVPETIEACAP